MQKVSKDKDKQEVEKHWYAFPEGLKIRDLSLGLLLFECLYDFDSIEEYSTTMLDLHQRVFPAQFLSESLLLHPEASSRPTTWRILQSDVLMNDSSNYDIVDDVESDVMLHFLASSTENTSRSVDCDIGICKFVVQNSTTDHTLNSSNGVCSISFDCDQEYIATAGRISRKIKIYDQFDSLLDLEDDSSAHLVVDHYPILELSNESRLTCICWNKFTKSYLASTDDHGLVQVWDTNTGQGVAKYNNEHQQTTWSVDFSQVDPTKFATGGSDRSIKIWNINERNSICTIPSFDNVSCVQFSPVSSHIVAFGSKDSNLYCYDLRKTKQPCFTLCGHEKAVCCVKFLDSQNLASASIDNTLKLWDLKKATLNEMSSNACILTYRGHTNVKNFVGMSVLDGYIACGSETNEVYAYDKSLPMPIARRKLGYVDPSSEEEKTNRKNVSVTSVRWRKKSQMLVHRLSSSSSSSSKGNENTVSVMHLREWLESDYCLSASKNERLQVFKKIVQVVHDYHSQGIGLMDLKPSSFIMIFKTGDVDVRYTGLKVNTDDHNTKKRSDFELAKEFYRHEKKQKVTTSFFIKGNRDSIYNNDQLEERWYARPEGLEIRDLCSANIHSLGLFLFECLYDFDSIEIHSTTMMDLHQRVFPAQFLSECPKEAGFCCWLLHPEASSLPTTWRILQSDVLMNYDIVDDVESDVMLHFLALSTENTTTRSVDCDIGIRKFVVCGTIQNSTDHTLNSSNGVYAYDKSLPMPIARRKLEYVDPSSEEEKTNRKNVYVTSVRWRKKSQMLVAGNSNGTVKILRMV